MRKLHLESRTTMIRTIEDCLSVVVSVHNAQTTIIAEIERLLDVAADARGSFEMIVVDDASTDLTWEILCELRTRFPQIKAIRNRSRQGLSASLDIGSQRAVARGNLATVNQGRIVAFDRPIAILDADPTLPIPSVPKPLGKKQLERLATWAGQVTEDVGLWNSPLNAPAKPATFHEEERRILPIASKMNAARSTARRNAGNFLDHLRHISFSEPSSLPAK